MAPPSTRSAHRRTTPTTRVAKSAPAKGRAQVEHLDAPAPDRRGGYLASGRLATRPEATRA